MVKPDLPVAGGGVAGMAAAATAVARGARVLVVEKGDGLGGSGALSPGVLWTAPDLHTFEEVCPRGDRELGRVLVEGFDAAIELVREAGVSVSERWERHAGFGVAVQIDIHGLLVRWEEEVLAGAGEIRRQTAVRQLLLDEEGAARGALLGAEEVEADAVLLATGGFQRDPVAQRQHVGPGADLMPVRSNPHSTGDGLRMGRVVGASLAGPMDGFHGHLVPSPLDRFSPEDFLLLCQEHSRHGLLLNRRGRRFTCEKWGDEVSSQALARQPGMRATLICDERVRREHVGERFELARAAGAHLVRAETLDGLSDYAERNLARDPPRRAAVLGARGPAIDHLHPWRAARRLRRARARRLRPADTGPVRSGRRRRRPARHRLRRRTRRRTGLWNTGCRRRLGEERYPCQILTS